MNSSLIEAYRLCIVLPCFNHGRPLSALLDRLPPAIPYIVVDDGSGEETRALLESIARTRSSVTLIRHEKNLGKGAATLRGMREAWALGYSHALQIDADGQHDAADVPRFAEVAHAHPNEVICGRPVFDTSVPAARLYGRWITHVLVWLETLSFRIVDSMCGFRVYPLRPVMELTAQGFHGTHMDFDTEILVRLFRNGVPVHFLATHVIYPPDGTSNFRMVRDNARMTWLHVRLLFGILHYLPRHLLRSLRRS